MESEPPMEAPREGRGVCPRGTVQPMGVRLTSRARARLPWRLGFRRVAPRATPGCRSSGKEAHSNGGVNAAGTNLEDCGRPLWRAPALPTWGPAPSDGVGSGPWEKPSLGGPLNLCEMPFNEEAERASRLASRDCRPNHSTFPLLPE